MNFNFNEFFIKFKYKIKFIYIIVYDECCKNYCTFIPHSCNICLSVWSSYAKVFEWELSQLSHWVLNKISWPDLILFKTLIICSHLFGESLYKINILSQQWKNPRLFGSYMLKS